MANSYPSHEYERLRTRVLYGFPLDHPGDMMPLDMDRRFLCCSECAAPLEKALTCSACEAAIYCNVSCQKAAWAKGHKQQCADLKQDRKKSSGTLGMYQPPPRSEAIKKKAEDTLREAVKDWIFQTMQAITTLAKINVQGDKDLSVNYHTYIVLLSRTIRKKNQPDGYRLCINAVFRVNRDRDLAVYELEYDGKKHERSDDRHYVQITCGSSSVYHGCQFTTAKIAQVVVPDIPIHALVNMYNSNLHDLSITATRKVPGFAEYWKEEYDVPDTALHNKNANVIDKEAKELGVDKIPEDAMERLRKMMKAAEATKEGLLLRETGREVIHANGRKEYIATGFAVNDQPVEPAVYPYFRHYFKNIAKSGFVLSNEADSAKRNKFESDELREDFYNTIIENYNKDPKGHGYSKETLDMADRMLWEDLLRKAFTKLSLEKEAGADAGTAGPAAEPRVD